MTALKYVLSRPVVSTIFTQHRPFNQFSWPIIFKKNWCKSSARLPVFWAVFHECLNWNFCIARHFSPFFIKYMNISISEIHTFEYKRSSIPYWLISIELQFKQWWKLLVLFDKFTLFVFTCAGIMVKVFLSGNLIANTRFSVAVCTF